MQRQRRRLLKTLNVIRLHKLRDWETQEKARVIRLKGLWWNAAHPSVREALCREMGWTISHMREYGRMVRQNRI